MQGDISCVLPCVLPLHPTQVVCPLPAPASVGYGVSERGEGRVGRGVEITLALPHHQNEVMYGTPLENLLSAVLDALTEPAISYIGLGYDTSMSLSEGNNGSHMLIT